MHASFKIRSRINRERILLLEAVYKRILCKRRHRKLPQIATVGKGSGVQPYCAVFIPSVQESILCLHNVARHCKNVC